MATEQDIERISANADDAYRMVLEQAAQIAQLKESVLILGKTLEGIQNLFIRAGEYQGKPRGKLP